MTEELGKEPWSPVPPLNLGETRAEMKLINEVWSTHRKIELNVECARGHLEKGDYANYVYHLAVVQLTCMAVGEEMVRELVSDEEMARMVADAAGDLAGMTAVLLRDLQTMKAQEEGGGE